jgi:hypothetical protein
MITEKSIFTLEIPEWITRVGTVPTLYYTKGEVSSRQYKKHAKKNRCQAILCDQNTKK